MIRLPFIVILLLLCRTGIYGQLYSTATASTSVDIITSVGAENSGETILASFYSGREPGTVVLNRFGMVVNGRTSLKDVEKETEIPFFHVSAGQDIYSITFSYDPLIINQSTVLQTMHVESLTIVPINEKKPEQPESDSYSIRAILQIGPSQFPGQYSPANPYRVTVNFN